MNHMKIVNDKIVLYPTATQRLIVEGQKARAQMVKGVVLRAVERFKQPVL